MTFRDRMRVEGDGNGGTSIPNLAPKHFWSGLSFATVFGIFLAVSGWIYGAGKDKARLNSLEKRLESVEKICAVIPEIKTDTNWIKKLLEEHAKAGKN